MLLLQDQPHFSASLPLLCPLFTQFCLFTPLLYRPAKPSFLSCWLTCFGDQLENQQCTQEGSSLPVSILAVCSWACYQKVLYITFSAVSGAGILVPPALKPNRIHLWNMSNLCISSALVFNHPKPKFVERFYSIHIRNFTHGSRYYLLDQEPQAYRGCASECRPICSAVLGTRYASICHFWNNLS